LTRLVIDTNFFGNLHEIDADCGLIDLLCDAYQRCGIADHHQLREMDYCDCLSSKLNHHNISDEQVAKFVMGYKGRICLEHIARDPVDLKLVVFVLHNQSSVFLTCEAKLLQLSQELNLDHSCFKAALHYMSERVGGIFGEKEYQTEKMFDLNGKNPFFHYCKNTRCSQCKDFCPTLDSPPKMVA
jgi:hypothetical protein